MIIVSAKVFLFVHHPPRGLKILKIIIAIKKRLERPSKKDTQQYYLRKSVTVKRKILSTKKYFWNVYCSSPIRSVMKPKQETTNHKSDRCYKLQFSRLKCIVPTQKNIPEIFLVLSQVSASQAKSQTTFPQQQTIITIEWYIWVQCVPQRSHNSLLAPGPPCFWMGCRCGG